MRIVHPHAWCFSFLILLPLNRNVFVASASIATGGFHPRRTPRQMPSSANPDELEEEEVAMDQHLKKNCRCLALCVHTLPISAKWMWKLLSKEVVAWMGATGGNQIFASQSSSYTHYFSMVFAISMPAQGEARPMVMWLNMHKYILYTCSM